MLPLVPSTTERDKKAVKREGKRRAIQPERLAQPQLGTHNANKNPFLNGLSFKVRARFRSTLNPQTLKP